MVKAAAQKGAARDQHQYTWHIMTGSFLFSLWHGFGAFTAVVYDSKNFFDIAITDPKNVYLKFFPNCWIILYYLAAILNFDCKLPFLLWCYWCVCTLVSFLLPEVELKIDWLIVILYTEGIQLSCSFRGSMFRPHLRESATYMSVTQRYNLFTPGTLF